MALRLIYFAWVRERVGVAGETVSPPEGVRTVGELIGWLAGQSGGHAAAFGEPARLRAAIDDAFVGLDAPIAGAREVAVFPPLTGG